MEEISEVLKLGIHSYLAYLRDRFRIAQDLLTESGTIFVQISDENLHLVRCILDEVFGKENYSGIVAFSKTSSQSTTKIQSVVDYLLVYAKNLESQKIRPVLRIKEPGEKGAKQYTSILSPDFSTMRKMTYDEIIGKTSIPDGWMVCRLGPSTSQGYSESRSKSYNYRGELISIPSNSHWKYDPTPGKDIDKFAKIGRLRKSGKSVAPILLARDNPTTPLDNIWTDTGTGSFTEEQIYVVQTANKAIQRCLLMTTDPGDIVLDPTCGSGTTAYVAEQWGRRWITIDTSRVALALARTRLMSARFPYYLLSDSPEGLAKEAEITKQRPPVYPTKYDVRKGFVYKRVPHITLKSIANNEEIDAIYEKYQAKLEPLRTSINKAAKKQWEEWEVPREAEGNSKVAELLAQWWALRQQRQKDIDASIALRADMEMLYDQPYDDPKRVRVSGPFTVESLSPHRILPADEDMDGTVTEKEAHDRQDFTGIILDNLKASGVDNRIKQERIKFASLDPFPGKWVHAKGTYADADGAIKSVAISIGPEHGTVGPMQVKEAAKEAVQGLGFDLLIICGFAFDPSVSDEAKRYGKLPVLPARMNNDLGMDELLKKTGAGNLFVVFGEPDIEIKKQPDKKIVVKIKGVDVYDPTTGAIRSSSTDDIACWFIDTEYNEESFFVRHAYFTGDKTKDPYEKLKRALRAEVDEAAWTNLYRYESLPFAVPETGKIAVKVINHYGDEVMKVYAV